MEKQHLLLVTFAVLQALAGGGESRAEDRPRGQVVLHAIDFDTKEPISGVVFFKQNIVGEDWFTELGSTDKNGELSIFTEPMPGYYFSVWRAPQAYSRAPKSKEALKTNRTIARLRRVKVAGLDDVASNVSPGSVVHHWFQFRKISFKDSGFSPEIKELPSDYMSRIPAPVQGRCTVTTMPGFLGRPVKFRFKTDEDGRVTPDQLRWADRLFHNGSRVYAAVKEELDMFQSVESQYKSDVEEIRQVTISIPRDPGESRNWMFRFHLPKGMPLRDGYAVSFLGLEDWELTIPDYVQPGF